MSNIFQVNERLTGAPRSSARPRSTGSNLQNRTVLDIRTIQPPIQPSVKRFHLYFD
jgi:hypothetical protein